MLIATMQYLKQFAEILIKHNLNSKARNTLITTQNLEVDKINLHFLQ